MLQPTWPGNRDRNVNRDCRSCKIRPGSNKGDFNYSIIDGQNASLGVGLEARLSDKEKKMTTSKRRVEKAVWLGTSMGCRWVGLVHEVMWTHSSDYQTLELHLPERELQLTTHLFSNGKWPMEGKMKGRLLKLSNGDWWGGSGLYADVMG